MTINSNTKKVSHPGDGAATTFSFSPLKIFKTSEIKVTLVVNATGAETTLSEGTGNAAYSVTAASGSYPSSSAVTGSITYPADAVTPVAAGNTLYITYNTDLKQETDLENRGAYFSETQEAALDKLAISIQQLQEQVDRCLKVPVSDSTNTELDNTIDRASKAIIFDASGVPTSGSVPTTGVTITSFAETFLDDANAAAVRTTIGAVGSNDPGVAFNLSEGADVASASTCDIWSNEDGNTLHITGTTGITSFGTANNAGAWRKLIFDDAVTLTHSANLNLPNSSNFTTAAGDLLLVYADTTTQFDVFILKKNGQPVATAAWTSGPSGTDGEIPTFDSSGSPSFVPVGTSGQVLTSNGAGAAPTMQTPAAFTTITPITLSSGSPTAVNLFTGASGVETIEIGVNGGSTNTGSQTIMVQLGDSGGFETSSYGGAGRGVNGTTTLNAFESVNSNGFICGANALQAAANVWTGTIVLKHWGSNVWSYHAFGWISANIHMSGTGFKTLSGELTQVRLTTSGGSAAFDGGTAYARYWS